MKDKLESEWEEKDSLIKEDTQGMYGDFVSPGKKNESDKEKPKRKPLSVVFEIFMYILLIYACVYFIPNYVIQRTIVEGPSMLDTLHNNDSLLVDKCYFKLKGLNRFDIIVFYPHGKKSEEYYVKRIIGLPGETLQIKGSDIYINGEKLEEQYGKDPITDPGLAEEPIILGAEEYFVLGDNREVSLDSRYEDVGVVQKENIGGRAIVRIWPFSRFGLID